jgi:hypothetical protein
MESAELALQLEKARRAVTEGETHIRRQRDLVFRLERAGKGTTEARALLQTLLQRQTQRQENLAFIIRQIQPDR